MAGFRNLLTGIRMESSGGIFSRATVNFGPFFNSSGFPLTITLNHVGGSSHRHATGIVNDIEIVSGNGGATVFTVPPNSSYRWHVKNEHSITASVPSAAVVIRDVGLPDATGFALPKRTGAYLGCINVYDEYDTTGDRGGDPYRIVAVEYYFTESPMSDSSDSWGAPLVKPEFGVVVAGPPPMAPGPCINPRERPYSDTGGS